MYFKCNCLNSGINGFTGRCGRCEMEKHVNEIPINIHSPKTLTEVLNNLEEYILKLDRYENSFGSGYGDCWGSMELDKNGEWIKLEDVLALFGAKKE